MIPIVLAAGLSTRLRPLTNSCPKPMLPVAGKPMLAYIVMQLHDAGFSNIIITTHYFPEVIQEYFGNGSDYGVAVTYVHETTLLDTAGSLRNAASDISEDVLVIGGNAFLPNLSFTEFIRFHEAKQGVGTIAFAQAHPPYEIRNFGQGVLDNNSRLLAFQEKPANQLGTLLHTTYQIYTREAIKHIPPSVQCSIPRYLIPILLSNGLPIYGYVAPPPFFCISTQAGYAWICDMMEKH